MDQADGEEMTALHYAAQRHDSAPIIEVLLQVRWRWGGGVVEAEVVVYRCCGV